MQSFAGMMVLLDFRLGLVSLSRYLLLPCSRSRLCENQFHFLIVGETLKYLINCYVPVPKDSPWMCKSVDKFYLMAKILSFHTAWKAGIQERRWIPGQARNDRHC